MIRPLCEAHDYRRVWSVGIETLGYPPNLVHTFIEVRRVADALESFRQKGNDDDRL